MNPLAVDFASGAGAGLFAGALVAPFEALKVELQRDSQKLSCAQILRSYETHKNMIKVLPSFSVLFSGVCALEFSINERIKQSYGNAAGVAASALTGSIFLTAADHLMFLRQETNQAAVTALQRLLKVRVGALWAGCTPMAAREALFITSVMHLGPFLGKRLGGDKYERDQLYWNSVGRVVSGVNIAFISQPLDTLAREMQMNLHKNPTRKPTFDDCRRSMKARLENGSHIESLKKLSHPLFKGAIPRMGLATMGGTIAGGFFQFFKEKIDAREKKEM